MNVDKNTYASLESQIGNEVCEVEDTEEIFWLRESDDYESKVKLGNLLSDQYRYKDAIEAYTAAMKIRSDDKMLHIRIAGAFLTIRQFSEAQNAYMAAMQCGATEKNIAYYMGVWHYLKGEYISAAEWFLKCLPCDDEMTIAVIYWHTLCCVRLGNTATLLSDIYDDMRIGHHTSYLSAMRVFKGTLDAETAMFVLSEEKNDLDFVVAAYGLNIYLELAGKITEAEILRKKLLEKKSVWPCISYLAAWADR